MRTVLKILFWLFVMAVIVAAIEHLTRPISPGVIVSQQPKAAADDANFCFKQRSQENRKIRLSRSDSSSLSQQQSV